MDLLLFLPLKLATGNLKLIFFVNSSISSWKDFPTFYVISSTKMFSEKFEVKLKNTATWNSNSNGCQSNKRHFFKGNFSSEQGFEGLKREKDLSYEKWRRLEIKNNHQMWPCYLVKFLFPSECKALKFHLKKIDSHSPVFVLEGDSFRGMYFSQSNNLLPLNCFFFPWPFLLNLWSVWPEKIAKYPQKLPKNDSATNMIDFDNFTKIA